MREQLQHLYANTLASDRFGCLKRLAAGKERELTKPPSLFIRQQIVTPVDQRTKGLVALQCRATPTGQEPEAIIEPRRDLFRRKYSRARRRQLNRQRDAVQAQADLR